jgi:hypothetical protein
VPFDSDPFDCRFNIDVTQFIWQENEVIFDFSGPDEGSKYSGICRLARNGDEFQGDALYRYDKELNERRARVVLTLRADDGEILANGIWTDDGETEPYNLEAEFLDD